MVFDSHLKDDSNFLKQILEILLPIWVSKYYENGPQNPKTIFNIFYYMVMAETYKSNMLHFVKILNDLSQCLKVVQNGATLGESLIQ